LERFLTGQMPEGEAGPLEEHLLDCDHCALALDSLASRDRLVEPLLGLEAAPDAEAGETVESLMHRLAGLPAPAPAAAVAAGIAVPAELGDYRVLREVGRGGMGVVYEAVQVSLGRRVALKVLPFAAALDAKQLQRFRNEAQAAAQLHHTNIVPVYGVGCEHGIHFYAMQYIEGRPVAALIAEQRQSAGVEDRGSSVEDRGSSMEDRGSKMEDGGSTPPGLSDPRRTDALSAILDPRSSILDPPSSSYRAAARIGVQVAEALAYAHRQGILHRDIKPSNLLLDAQGTVWVTDFGLAKAEGGDELTRSGDVIGTFRYLAPERFEGLSGPRNDIYSLGATLYEMLTLRPAFDAADRPRLIERVMRGERPRPRQLDSRIPGDLETIVLKAMAPDPADRYPSAEALAEDLGRFLLDRPIQARRARLWERSWRWCRRNRVVAGLLTTAVMLAVGLAVLALMLWDRQQQAEAALREAGRQRQAAEERRQIAETNFQLACGPLNDEAIGHQLEWADKYGAGKGRQETLAKTLAWYQGFLREPGSDPGARMLMARLSMQVGDIQIRLDRRADALRSYRRAAALLGLLVEEFPREAGFRNLLAACYGSLGYLTNASAHPEEAEQAYRRAIALYDGLRREFPYLPWHRQQLGSFWHALGEHLRQHGRFREGAEALRRAVAIRQRLSNEVPGDQESKHWLADTHKQLAWVLAIRPDRQPGDAAEAVVHARKAVELEPDSHDPWHTLGVAYCRTGNWREALAALEKSRQLQPKEQEGSSFQWFFEAMARAKLGDQKRARRCYDQAVQWMQQHAPGHADLRRFRAEAAETLGIGKGK
jgi:serine/threonine-protein kinase